MAEQVDPVREALRLLVDARLGRTPPPSERAGVLEVWRTVWRGRETQAPEAARAYLRDARWWPAPGEVLRLAPAPVAAPSTPDGRLNEEELLRRVRAPEHRLWSEWFMDRMNCPALLLQGDWHAYVARHGMPPAWTAMHEYVLRPGLGLRWRDLAEAQEAVREGERRLRDAGALPPLERWTWASLVADVWGAA